MRSLCRFSCELCSIRCNLNINISSSDDAGKTHKQNGALSTVACCKFVVLLAKSDMFLLPKPMSS